MYFSFTMCNMEISVWCLLYFISHHLSVFYESGVCVPLNRSSFFHRHVNIRYNYRISSVENSHILHLFYSCPLGSDFLSYPWITLFQIHHSQLLIWWSTESFFNHSFLLTMQWGCRTQPCHHKRFVLVQFYCKFEIM